MSEATATGTLEGTPMSQLLVYALDKQLDGTFVFQSPEGAKSALLLREGRPIKAKTAEPVVHLGRLLLELGAIDEPTYNRTLVRLAKEKRLHGQILIDAGAIDEATLEVALGEQLIKQVVWLFALPPQTAYGFYAGKDFLERWAGEGFDIEPLTAIWRGIRSYEHPQRVDLALSRLGPRPIKLHWAAQPTRFRFAAADRPILDVIRAKPQTLGDLLTSGVGDMGVIKRMIYALMITRHLDVGAQPIGIGGEPPETTDTGNTARRFARRVERMAKPAPPTAPPPSSADARRVAAPVQPLASAPMNSAPKWTPPTAPDPEPSAQFQAFEREVTELGATIAGQNYYEILGVDREAPTTEISAAFFQLAKKFHPDRLRPELAPLKSAVVKLFARMTEAHQTLTDADKRKDYDGVLLSGGGSAEEQEEVQKVMRAVVAHQKASVLFKKQSLAEAERFAKEAMEGDPEQSEYVALYVRIVSQKAERLQSGSFDDLVKLMQEAVKRDPENERVRYARAELFKRAGRSDEALRDFRWCADRNPRNLDAIREVRLHAMRAGEKPPPGPAKPTQRPGARPTGKPDAPKDEKGGLLGKLFKR